MAPAAFHVKMRARERESRNGVVKGLDGRPTFRIVTALTGNLRFVRIRVAGLAALCVKVMAAGYRS